MTDPDPRILTVVRNDRESEARTPALPLHPVPVAARDPYAMQPPSLEWPGPAQLDLSRIAPGRPQAQGDVIEVSGRIVDEDLRPVRNALVEIWNCNSFGRYSHIDDGGANDARLDPDFLGFGRLVTDDDGRYHLRTIRPAGYLARADIGWFRPPHIHFSILGGGPRLVTQMYFPGNDLNERDFIYLAVPEAERSRTIGTALAVDRLQWDIVMRGRHVPPFDVD